MQRQTALPLTPGGHTPRPSTLTHLFAEGLDDRREEERRLGDVGPDGRGEEVKERIPVLSHQPAAVRSGDLRVAREAAAAAPAREPEDVLPAAGPDERPVVELCACTQHAEQQAGGKEAGVVGTRSCAIPHPS
jgi:hypothetical protein